MNYIHLAIGIGFMGVVVYYYLTKNYGYWKKTRVPYLKDSVPGLGNVYPMLLMKKSMMQMYRDFYNEIPGCSMVGFYNLRNPALLIREPELVKSVLQTNFSSFSSNGVDIDPNTNRLMSGNPFILEGEKWKTARQQLSAAFTSGKLKYMYSSIDGVRKKLVDYLNDKITNGNGEVEIELKTLYSRFTAEVVASAAFGIEGNSFKDDGSATFMEIGKTVFEPSFIKGMKQFIVFFIPLFAKVFNLTFIPLEVEKVFMKLIKDMLKYRADHNTERNDFLQLMINLQKSGASNNGVNGGNFTEDAIASHSASFFFDGYETSSIALSFAVHQLANHPEIQQRVRDEILAAVKKHNGITYEAIQEMTYMDQVIQESLRMYPPGAALFKVCTNEIILKGSDGITCRVTPGTHVMIPVAGLHKDPEYWPNPDKFDPDRFTEENKQKRHRFTHIPFGEGPRICIGMRFAMLQVKAAIATTLQSYILEPSPKSKIPIELDPRYFITFALGGLWVKLKTL